jgi:competence protein ComEC
MRSPAFWAAVAFVLGIVIADQIVLSTYLLLALLILLIILCLILLKHSGWLLTGLLLFTLFMAGFWRYEMATSDFPWNHISNFTNLNSSVILTGQIVEDPDLREDRTYLTVAADSLTWQLKKFKTSGKILIRVKEPSNRFNYGDQILVYGYIFSPLGKRNPGTFDYQRYLSTKGIYGQMNVDFATEVAILSRGGNFILSKIIAPARKYVLQHFHQSLPAPYDNFLAGFVLGEKRGMPEELRQKFVRTGTLHLMAVSGSNVGLILLFAYFISALLRLPRWLKFGFLALVIIFFALLTNLQPSVVRASVMALLALIAFYTEREINFLNLISFTALLILFFNPQALYDVSFQLSFASVAAIGILLPQMQIMYGRVFKTKPKLIYR